MKSESVHFIFYIDSPRCRRYLKEIETPEGLKVATSAIMSEGKRFNYFKDGLTAFLKLQLKPGNRLGYVKVTEAYEFREVKL